MSFSQSDTNLAPIPKYGPENSSHLDNFNAVPVTHGGLNCKTLAFKGSYKTHLNLLPQDRCNCIKLRDITTSS